MSAASFHPNSIFRPKTMTMGAVTGVNAVLKLVRPGGFVEFHKNPITAGEVMKKYPRHCVTRPDVFKYPWIVVRPESVLNPGQVFFLVPYHTIHRLLQKNGLRNHSSSLQDRRPRIKNTSPLKSQAKVTATTKHHGRDSCLDKQEKDNPVESSSHDRFCNEQYNSVESNSVKLTHFHRLVKKKSTNGSWNKENRKHDQDCHRSKYPDDQFLKKQTPIFELDAESQAPRKQYPVERWPKAILLDHKHHHHHQKLKPPSPDESFADARTSFSRDSASDHDAQGHGRFSSDDDGVKLKNSLQITKPKSCLKKDKKDVSKSRLRVTFSFPGEDDKELRIKVCEF